MIHPEDLIRRANQTLYRGRGRPKEVDLRRAVSDAYYALFHALTAKSARLLVSGGRQPQRAYIRRLYTHSNLKSVCASYRSNRLPHQLPRCSTDPATMSDVRELARAFGELQEARHDADYAHETSFLELDTKTLVSQAETALAICRRLTPASDDYVFTFFLALFASPRRHPG